MHPLSPEIVWTSTFDSLVQQMRPCFVRQGTWHRMQSYLRGLLSPVERKNGWRIAEEIGAVTLYGVQYLLDRAKWDEDAVRDALRTYVCEVLADPPAILILDETGFLKKGTKSVGVQRQYSGTAGRIENCQIGVFLGYAAAAARTFLDRELYLPKSWTEDRDRCREAGVPDQVEFATKPELAKRMIERAMDADVPAGWVT